MELNEYERRMSRLYNSVRRITDCESLLRLSCALLPSNLAVLVRMDASEHLQLVGSWVSLTDGASSDAGGFFVTEDAGTEREIQRLRQKIHETMSEATAERVERRRGIESASLGGPWEFCSKKHSDVLWVHEAPRSAHQPDKRYELYLFKASEADAPRESDRGSASRSTGQEATGDEPVSDSAGAVVPRRSSGRKMESVGQAVPGDRPGSSVEKDDRFSSYDCVLAEWLFIWYERVRLSNDLGAEESRRARYQTFLARNALPGLSWSDLRQWLESHELPVSNAAGDLGRAPADRAESSAVQHIRPHERAVICLAWISYQVRRWSHGQDVHDIEAARAYLENLGPWETESRRHRDVHEHCRAVSGLLVVETAAGPFGAGGSPGFGAPYHRASGKGGASLVSLTDQCEVLNRFLELAHTRDSGSSGTSQRTETSEPVDSRSSRDSERLRASVEPSLWERLREDLDPLEVVAVLALEQMWRCVLKHVAQVEWGVPRRLDGGPQHPVHCDGDPSMFIRRLMTVTNHLVGRVLARSDWNKYLGKENLTSGSAGPSEANGMGSCRYSNIDRDVLRLYFAYLLTTTETLEERYFGCPEECRTECDHPCVPPEVRRAFLATTARFMLDVIERIQRRFGLWTELSNVSRTEVLDAFVFLVDRYVHVELGVDERLDCRARLSATLQGEVARYLTLPHYRDHLLHVLDVFLLGHMLLHTRLPKKVSLPSDLLDFLVRNRPPIGEESTGRKHVVSARQLLLQNWAVAALLHDIGYAVAHARNRDRPEAWLRYLEWDDPQKKDEKEAWEQFAKDDPVLPQRLSELLGDLPWQDQRPKHRDEVALVKDHGVASALQVLEVINRATKQDDLGGSESEGMRDTYRDALRAMAYHNLDDKRIELAALPLTALLRLCDELQEWERKRVNIEAMVKQIYVQVLEDTVDPGVTRDILQGLRANVRMTRLVQEWRHKDEDRAAWRSQLKLELIDEIDGTSGVARGLTPFVFRLLYRNSAEAQFDPVMTLLSKMHRLQYVGWTANLTDPAQLAWRIELAFPRPREYGRLSEYDIYAAFTERIRWLPLLRVYADVTDAASGLSRLTGRASEGVWKDRLESGTLDAFSLVLPVDPKHKRENGWMAENPESLRKLFLKHKRRILRREGGRGRSHC